MTSATEKPTLEDYKRVLFYLDMVDNNFQPSKPKELLSTWQQWESDCKLVEKLQKQFKGNPAWEHFFGMLDERIAEKFDRLFAVR